MYGKTKRRGTAVVLGWGGGANILSATKLSLLFYQYIMQQSNILSGQAEWKH
jgi:hypothetical protein